MSESLFLWGTGELVKKWLTKHGSERVTALVDPQKDGEIDGIAIISPQQLKKNTDFKLIICSSAWSAILAQHHELREIASELLIFTPSERTITLDDCVNIPEKGLYFLPWQKDTAEWQALLSNEIVFPGVYRELANSVSYAYISSVEGDIAEFGTCSGHTASFIANAMNYYSRNLTLHDARHQQGVRKLHLFDSFEGFPAATQQADLDSPHVASGAWGEGVAKGLNATQLRALCQQFLEAERIKVYEGWYKDTLSTINPDTRLAMAHIDCDLYESTMDVLNALFEQQVLSEGAMLLFDNWFCNKASPNYGEQKAWQQIQQKFDIQFTNLGIYACYGNRIIIHSYKKRVSS